MLTLHNKLFSKNVNQGKIGGQRILKVGQRSLRQTPQKNIKPKYLYPSKTAPQTSNFEDEDDDFFNSVDIPEDVPLQRVAPKRSLAGNSKIETTSPTSNITNRSTKPFEYLKNIPDSDEELHIIKGCIGKENYQIVQSYTT